MPLMPLKSDILPLRVDSGRYPPYLTFSRRSRAARGLYISPGDRLAAAELRIHRKRKRSEISRINQTRRTEVRATSNFSRNGQSLVITEEKPKRVSAHYSPDLDGTPGGSYYSILTPAEVLTPNCQGMLKTSLLGPNTTSLTTGNYPTSVIQTPVVSIADERVIAVTEAEFSHLNIEGLLSSPGLPALQNNDELRGEPEIFTLSSHMGSIRRGCYCHWCKDYRISSFADDGDVETYSNPVYWYDTLNPNPEPQIPDMSIPWDPSRQPVEQVSIWGRQGYLKSAWEIGQAIIKSRMARDEAIFRRNMEARMNPSS